MSFLSRLVDERFLEHRRRSTSTAGIMSTLFAVGLFEYRLFVHHTWDWAVLGIGLVFVAVKLSLMVYYAFAD